MVATSILTFLTPLPTITPVSIFALFYFQSRPYKALEKRTSVPLPSKIIAASPSPSGPCRLVQSLLILISFMMYFAKVEEYVLLMVFALLLGWVNMLYYTRGVQQMGIYIVMIQKAILRNLLHFLMVYVIFLFGFATVLIVLTGDASRSAHNGSLPLSNDPKGQAMYARLLQISLQLFKFTIGMGDLEYHENKKHGFLVILLLLLFVILTYILLLNMLIALMSETVINVSGYSQGIWKLQRAIAILEIERNRIWCWKKSQRAGCFLSVGSEDKRWLFRVEEVNWEDWNEKLNALREDPMVSSVLEKESSELKLQGWLARAKARLAASKEEEQEGERVPLQTVNRRRSRNGSEGATSGVSATTGPTQTGV